MGDAEASWDRVAALTAPDEGVSVVRFSSDRWRATAEVANGENLVTIHATGRSEQQTLEALAEKIVRLRGGSEANTVPGIG